MTQESEKNTSDIYLATLFALRQVDVSTYLEIDIQAPAEVVWGYLTDDRMGRYSPAHYSLVNGAWGEVGCVIEVHSAAGREQHPFPRTRQKVIDSIANKYLVYRMSCQVSEDAVETFTGYDVLILQEVDGMTKLIFVQPLAFGNLNITKEQLPAFKEGQRLFITTIFAGLKTLVESEYRR